MGRWRIVSVKWAGQSRKEEKAKKQANSRGVSRLDAQRTRQTALQTDPAPAPRGLVNRKWRRQAVGSSPGEILVAKAEKHTVPNTTVPNAGRQLQEWHTVSTQGLLPCSSKETVLGKAGCELSQPRGCWEGNSSTAPAPMSNLWTPKLLDRECVSGRTRGGWQEEVVLGPASRCDTIRSLPGDLPHEASLQQEGGACSACESLKGH